MEYWPICVDFRSRLRKVSRCSIKDLLAVECTDRFERGSVWCHGSRNRGHASQDEYLHSLHFLSATGVRSEIEMR
jgi:hypothetical protein